MNQPAFLSTKTISYSKALATTTPEFTEALVAWCKASTPEDPISALDGYPEAQQTMINARADADAETNTEDGCRKTWDQLCIAYKDYSKNKVKSLLKALDNADLWYALESNSGSLRLIARTENEIIARADLPADSRFKNVTEALILVLSIYGPKPV